MSCARILNSRLRGGGRRPSLQMSPFAALLLGSVEPRPASTWGAAARVARATADGPTLTWGSEHAFAQPRFTGMQTFTAEEEDVAGNDVDVDAIVGPAGFRALAEEMSGDMGSGSGEAGSGDAPSSPPPPSPSDPPSPPLPSPPPSPPLAPSPLSPGSSLATVNQTVITVVVVINSTVEDFGVAQRATFKDNLRAKLCPDVDSDGLRCPGVVISLTVEAGSVVVRSVISYREDSIADAAVLTRAAQMSNATVAQLSADLGQPVLEPVTVTWAFVPVQVVVPAPSPPPPSPSAEGEAPAAPPPTSPPEASGDLETWVVAVIAVIVSLTLLCLGLVTYRCISKNKASSNIHYEGGSKLGDFPLAIGASTTQHV